MNDERDLPAARPVEVREVFERPSPWLPPRQILLNLALMSVGGGLFWLVIDHVGAPWWSAVIAAAFIVGTGTALVRLLRRHRAPRTVD